MLSQLVRKLALVLFCSEMLSAMFGQDVSRHVSRHVASMDSGMGMLVSYWKSEILFGVRLCEYWTVSLSVGLGPRVDNWSIRSLKRAFDGGFG